MKIAKIQKVDLAKIPRFHHPPSSIQKVSKSFSKILLYEKDILSWFLIAFVKSKRFNSLPPNGVIYTLSEYFLLLLSYGTVSVESWINFLLALYLYNKDWFFLFFSLSLLKPLSKDSIIASFTLRYLIGFSEFMFFW